jgi:hypothetical protein
MSEVNQDSTPTSFLFLREYFNWSYENPDLVNCTITSLYSFIIDHHSRLGFKEKFGLPTVMAMEAIGVKNYKTYKKAFDFLVKEKFITVVEPSRNQYSSNIIAMVKNTKANTKALAKASTKHSTKQVESSVLSSDLGSAQSSVDIDKLNTKNLIKKIYDDFDIVWGNYGKIGSKKKALQIWANLDEPTRDKISKSIPGYLDHIKKTGYAQKHFTSYLNSDEYENYLNFSTLSSGEIKVEQIKILPNLSNNFEFSLIHKLKGLNQQERWEYYRANRPECSEVFQHTRKYQGDDYDSFCLLDRTHPLRKFTADYHNFVEYENNNL